MQALVNTLLDVFDASRDLYQTLKSKQRRDYEHNLRSRGYRRSVDYVDDGPDGEEEIIMDKAAVLRTFDVGLDEVGTQFAVGDGKTDPSTDSIKARTYPTCLWLSVHSSVSVDRLAQADALQSSRKLAYKRKLLFCSLRLSQPSSMDLPHRNPSRTISKPC